MPVRKKCGNCGAPVPDDASVFCSRCGARLPATGSADRLTCRTCGITASDPESRFCDHCGSPLAPKGLVVTPSAPAGRAVTPAVPEEKGTVCPTCGFKNLGKNPFYCKKCGVYIPKKSPVQQYEPRGTAPVDRLQEGSVRIRPDGREASRQRPVHAPVAGRQPTAGAPVLPRKRRQEAPEKRDWRSYRKVALGAAGVILLLLILALITGNIPGMPPAGSDTTTAPDSTSPGLFEALPWGLMSNQLPFINQATPVVTDTPVEPELEPEGELVTGPQGELVTEPEGELVTDEET